MTRAKLPSRVEDAWERGLTMRPPRPVCAVSCAGGRVVAGGRELYLIRAGTDAVLARKLPDDVLGTTLAVVSEPRPPWRIALAPDDGRVLVFEPQGGDVTSIERDPPHGDARATHLAWERGALHARWDDGAISRIRRIEADGNARRICELTAVGGPAAEMRALAWDESRSTLWGASPEAGLVRHTPRAARKQRRSMS
jgi:hypothetical protein